MFRFNQCQLVLSQKVLLAAYYFDLLLLANVGGLYVLINTGMIGCSAVSQRGFSSNLFSGNSVVL